MPGISMMGKPNAEQAKRLKQYFNRRRADGITVEFDSAYERENGEYGIRTESFYFSPKVSPDIILEEINAFYDTGAKPVYAEDDGLMFAVGGRPITVDSTEEERYEALKERDIMPAAPNKERLSNVQNEIAELPDTGKTSLYGKERNTVKKAMQAIAKKLGIRNILLENDEITDTFTYSNRNVGVSAMHQQEYGGTQQELATAISSIDELAKNATLIEIHKEKKDGTARENKELKQTYVLLSALDDGEQLLPVQLEVKEYYADPMGLYMTVALGKIKKPTVINTTYGNSEENSSNSYRLAGFPVSVQYILENVNPEDKRFLKYAPDGFLNEAQKAAKREALQDQEEEYRNYGAAKEIHFAIGGRDYNASVAVDQLENSVTLAEQYRELDELEDGRLAAVKRTLRGKLYDQAKILLADNEKIKYDTDFSGSYTQAEYTALVTAMPGLDKEQRAALWQMLAHGKKNPFDAEIGKEIYDDYGIWSNARKKAETEERKRKAGE